MSPSYADVAHKLVRRRRCWSASEPTRDGNPNHCGAMPGVRVSSATTVTTPTTNTTIVAAAAAAQVVPTIAGAPAREADRVRSRRGLQAAGHVAARDIRKTDEFVIRTSMASRFLKEAHMTMYLLYNMFLASWWFLYGLASRRLDRFFETHHYDVCIHKNLCNIFY